MLIAGRLSGSCPVPSTRAVSGGAMELDPRLQAY